MQPKRAGRNGVSARRLSISQFSVGWAEHSKVQQRYLLGFVALTPTYKNCVSPQDVFMYQT